MSYLHFTCDKDRFAFYEKVIELSSNGMTCEAIAQQLHCNKAFPRRLRRALRIIASGDRPEPGKLPKYMEPMLRWAESRNAPPKTKSLNEYRVFREAECFKRYSDIVHFYCKGLPFDEVCRRVGVSSMLANAVLRAYFAARDGDEATLENLSAYVPAPVRWARISMMSQPVQSAQPEPATETAQDIAMTAEDETLPELTAVLSLEEIRCLADYLEDYLNYDFSDAVHSDKLDRLYVLRNVLGVYAKCVSALREAEE